MAMTLVTLKQTYGVGGKAGGAEVLQKFHGSGATLGSVFLEHTGLQGVGTVSPWLVLLHSMTQS